MVLVDSPEAEEISQRTGNQTLIAFAALIALLAMAFLCGIVGFVFSSPGGSIVLPTILVAFVALFLTVVGWVALSAVNSPLIRIGFVVLAILVGVSACWWTYTSALSAQIAQDASATTQAVTALRGASSANSAQCRTLTGDDFGPIRAPYSECATPAPAGGFVTYASVESDGKGLPAHSVDRGVVFNLGPVSNLTGLCVRHLVDGWWAWANSAGQCSTGYQYVPSPF
jgi:multisubunit Na+/H+ antiporter MnhB subunit